MRWEDVYISSAAAWLGGTEDVRTAVAEGRYDAEECATQDYLSVRVTDGRSPADMAVAAGRLAMERSGRDAADVEVLLHASVGYQGLDHWTPAGYIQQRTIAGRAAACEVKQASNGAMAALQLAAAHVSVGSSRASALITTGDAYTLPTFDRYRSDKGTIRGDGASALVVTRGEGVARLLSTTLIGDTAHEGLQRGTEPWAGVPGEHGWPVSIRRRRDQYLAGRDGGVGQEVSRMLVGGVEESLRGALADAKTDLDEVARFVLPHLGRGALTRMYQLAEFGIDMPRTTWGWGRTAGHLGAGDQGAGLAHLLETGAVRVGDRVVLCGVGVGYTFGTAVLEITRVPDWSDSTG